MIARLLCLLLLVLSFTVSTLAQPGSGKLKITYSKNIETYFLAELLSVDYRTKNKDWEAFKRRECAAYQPIVNAAIDELKHLESDDIALKTALLNDTLMSYGLGNDALMAPLLYHNEFPNKGYRAAYTLRSTSLNEQRQAEVNTLIRRYIEELNNFYRTKNVGAFFEKHERFYKGASNEVAQYVNDNMTTAMEQFYGQKKLGYVVLVSPMMMWPIEDNEGRGIGATVTLPKGDIVYEIMSPYVKVSAADVVEKQKLFGFDYKPRAEALTIHEFGHSFVNSDVDKFSARITRSDTLFTDTLKKVMASKGVASWQVYIIESLVRLGEIRVAERQHDKQRAELLRKYHTNQEHFIFLPLLESSLKTYEKNRKKYPTFSTFIPDLLDVVERKDKAFVEAQLPKS